MYIYIHEVLQKKRRSARDEFPPVPCCFCPRPVANLVFFKLPFLRCTNLLGWEFIRAIKGGERPMNPGNRSGVMGNRSTARIRLRARTSGLFPPGRATLRQGGVWAGARLDEFKLIEICIRPMRRFLARPPSNSSIWRGVSLLCYFPYNIFRGIRGGEGDKRMEGYVQQDSPFRPALQFRFYRFF